MAQHEADVDRTWVKVNARAEELDGLINSNKTLVSGDVILSLKQTYLDLFYFL